MTYFECSLDQKIPCKGNTDVPAEIPFAYEKSCYSTKVDPLLYTDVVNGEPHGFYLYQSNFMCSQ